MRAISFIFSFFTFYNSAIAQFVTIDGAVFAPISYIYGTENIVAVENRSSLPDGKITIVEKNLCPQNYKGGTLYQIYQAGTGTVRKGVIINNELYMPLIATLRIPGLNFQLSGGAIFTFGPPFPEQAYTLAISNLFVPGVYSYKMTCYYTNGCPELGPNVGTCQWNSPHYFVAINLNSSMDLSIGNVSIDSDLAADEKYMIAPTEQYQVNVPISGSGISTTDTRDILINLQIGSQMQQKTIPLSSITSEGITVPFFVSMPIDDVGDQVLQVTIDPVNSLNEINRQNNSTSQTVHVLCNVQKNGITVPWFYQTQEPWRTDIYANQGTDLMEDYGCVVTNLAMLFNFYDIDTAADGSKMDPRSVNRGLSSTMFYPEIGPNYASYNGYTPTGGVQPNGAVSFARNSFFMNCIKTDPDLESCLNKSKNSISYKKSVDNFSESSKKIVNKELCNGNPVILKVPSISTPDDPTKAHYILATGMDVDANGNQTYITNNPGFSTGRNSIEYASTVRGFRLYQPTYDPSMVFFHLNGNVDMIITDPQGRRSGLNPLSQEFFSEIPGGTYFSAESISSPTDPNKSTPAEVRFEGMEPLSGEYQVQVFAKSNTEYRLTQYSFDTTGTINNVNDQIGRLEKNDSTTIQLNHKEESIPYKPAILSIDKANYIDTKYKDMAFISGTIELQNGQSNLDLKEYLFIKVGTFTKTISKSQLKKIKILGKTNLVYGSFGKNSLYLNLNLKTGNFNLFIGSSLFDENESSSVTTEVMIKLDEITAKNQATFFNKRKNKINAK